METANTKVDTTDSNPADQPWLNKINLSKFLNDKKTPSALGKWFAHFSISERPYTQEDILVALLKDIALIDELINDQLNAIIHHKKFQQMESRWRGIGLLTDQAGGHRKIKIKMLDISWREVSRDIDKALEFDQSQLFQKIYSTEFGTPGGEPYGILLGDYVVSHRPTPQHPYNDISTLKGMAQVAAAAFAPFIIAPSPSLFGLETYDELARPIDLATVFSIQEYIPWNSLRDSEDSRFIGLALPRVLLRKPYQLERGDFNGIYFKEKMSNNKENALWGNACFAFGAVLVREFASVGWFSHIRGAPRDYIGGGLVTQLVNSSHETDRTNVANKYLTDILVTDTKERELSDLGFIPLCDNYDTQYATFHSNASMQKAKTYTDNGATLNAKLSAMIQHILCGSRFAHYIKVMLRDKVGSFVTASDCEYYLQKWLNEYTTGRDDLDWETQAQYPLREGSVEVKEIPSKPGCYWSIIHLKPHYQADHLVSELKLTTELNQITSAA